MQNDGTARARKPPLARLDEVVAALARVPVPDTCASFPSAPLCNDAFPGAFNLSLTEPEMLEQFGSYLDIDRNYTYSKLQPCIRFNDWPVVRADPLGEQDRLLLFHIADVGGIQLVSAEQAGDAAVHSIKSLLIFLLDYMQLDSRLLRFKLLRRAMTLAELTQGRCRDSMLIPPFRLLEETLLGCGLHEENLLGDATRDAFVSPRIYGLPAPWGYRSEVLYQQGRRLVDIATLQMIVYRPVFSGSEVVRVIPWHKAAVLAAIGVERIAASSSQHAHEGCVGFLADTLRVLRQKASWYDSANALIFAQALAAIAALLPELDAVRRSRHRNRKFAALFTTLIQAGTRLRLDWTSGTMSLLYTTEIERRRHICPHAPNRLELFLGELSRRLPRAATEDSQ